MVCCILHLGRSLLWFVVSNKPNDEYDTTYLYATSFPTYIPFGAGDVFCELHGHIRITVNAANQYYCHMPFINAFSEMSMFGERISTQDTSGLYECRNSHFFKGRYPFVEHAHCAQDFYERHNGVIQTLYRLP
jgi:hypothetical protein